ncbi:GGDEF domain-containing protein [Mycobacterium sp. Lab-001]|uniref:GGDEF domain-containing protein n=1 Tax=Mycobacterium sp. Lab-001 TaxID=3410136 RepID=UPI003D17348A
MRLRADAGKGFYGEHQIRLLRIYLVTTTFLYIYGVVFGNLIPIHPGLARGNSAGGIAAVVLGLAALVWLAVRPGKPAPATAVAIGATPAVMAFHHVMVAEFACLIAPMFLAMYLRAFYSPRRGALLVGVLTGACVLALPLSHAASLYLDYVVFVIAIVGAAESFGLVARTLVAAAEQFVAGVRLHTPDTSVGTASHSGETADIAALHAAADAGLYAAKRIKRPDTRLDAGRGGQGRLGWL